MNIYDMIIKSIDGTESILDKTICSKITKLPQNNIEDIYLLILHHSIKNHKNNKEGLILGKEFPYGGKLIDKKNIKGLAYKPVNLPNELQKIIYRYLETI